MSRLAHLAQRLFNVPLMIHPGKAEVVMAALASRFGIGSFVNLEGETVVLAPGALDDADDSFTGRGRSRERQVGYDMVGDVAVITISGTLVQKLGTLRPYSGMTGYDGIRQNLLTAVTDPNARAIVLDIDSPGGEVAGCFDLVDTIFACRGEKPLAAILNENAYSAAYAIASAVDPGRLYVPRTGGTGSIGVIAMHVDFSQALTEAGIKVTFIKKGDRKADGRAEIPLSPEALAAIQADIDAMADLFFETVARNRGLSAAKIEGFQAGTFMGAAGVQSGLADKVRAPDAAFRDLVADLV